MTTPHCVDCKHLRQGLFQHPHHWKCVSPQNGSDPVTGETVIHRAHLVRDYYTIGCTKYAKFFEAKP